MSDQKPTCEVLWLGSIDFQEAWDLQRRMAEKIASRARPATLLLLEHPHTFTFGRSGHAENLLWDAGELARNQVKVFWVDRGGDVTYHGPGQLVGYPLLPLASSGWTDASGEFVPMLDTIGYLRRLEKVLICALAVLGLPGCITLEKLTGVWAPVQAESHTHAKIASIGVKVNAQRITTHGFALNVNPVMRYWQGIISCGLADRHVCSMAELLPNIPDMRLIVQAVSDAFGREFGYRMVDGIYPETPDFV